jgi:hypothetical protein
MAKNPFIAVRVPPYVIESLDQLAAQSKVSRSQIIKELLENCHAFYKFIEMEKSRQNTGKIDLDGNLTDWILANMKEDMTPEWVHFIGEVMHHVADEMVTRKTKEETPEATN